MGLRYRLQDPQPVGDCDGWQVRARPNVQAFQAAQIQSIEQCQVHVGQLLARLLRFARNTVVRQTPILREVVVMGALRPVVAGRA